MAKQPKQIYMQDKTVEIDELPIFEPELTRIKETFISTHWDWKIMEHEGELTLIEALKEKLPHIDGKSWQSRLKWGGTFVNGRDAGEDAVLEIPCRIEYYEPKFDYTRSEEFFPVFEKNRICYEDEHLIIYVKPGRLPCVPGREQRYNNLRKYIDTYVGAACHMPSRLDMSTCGLVPASKHPMTHHALQKVYQFRKVKKRYILQTDREVLWNTNKVENKITKHPAHPVLRRCSNLEGKDAVTEFKVLRRTKNEHGAPLTLIEARPITGRTHQIRLHAHALGCPIIGDNFYLGTPHKDGLHLGCYELGFPHPLTGEDLLIQIPEELRPEWMILN